MNLTEQQKELLRLLVEKHLSNGGTEFFFSQSITTGAGITYQAGDSVNVSYDEIDFRELERAGLLRLTTLGRNLLSGKATEGGITLVRNGFALSSDGVPLPPGEAGRRTEDPSENARDWRDLSPDDPRYKWWQLIGGVFQLEESKANENFIENLRTDRAESAVLTDIVEKYDSCGQACMLMVTNVAKAQDVAEILRVAVELTLAAFGPMFQACGKYGLPADSLQKQARIHLLSRMEHWKIQAFQYGLEGELRALKKDATNAMPENVLDADDVAQPCETESAGAVPVADAKEADRRRAAIDGFMAAVVEKTGRKIIRKDIWTVAGYKDATEFERFQRNDRTTQSAANAFNRILRMTPAKFIEMLDKKSAPE